MDIVLVPLLLLIKSLLSLIGFVVIADVIISFLVSGNILNVNNSIVYSIVDTVKRISDYVCNPVRRNFPVVVGMLDFSPIIVFLVLTFFEQVIARILMKLG